MFSNKDLVPYSEIPPRCPKCGNKIVGRTYHPFGSSEFMSGAFAKIKTEFLALKCGECGYEWPQKTKEAT